MPVYVNLNAYPISISLSVPRRSITLFPWSSVPSRLPDGALTEVEIDAEVGAQLARTGQITLKTNLPAALAPKVAPVAKVPPKAPAVPVDDEDDDEAPTVPIAPVKKPSQDELDEDEETFIPSAKRGGGSEDSVAVPAEIDPGAKPSPKKPRYKV